MTKFTSLFRINWSLQKQLLAVAALGLFIMLSFTIIQTSQAAKKQGQIAVQNSLSNSLKIMDEYSRYRLDLLKSHTKVLASDPFLRPALIAGDTNRLSDLVSEYRESFGLGLMIIVDGSGKVLARSDNPKAVGSFMKRGNLLEKPLESGKLSSGFMKRKDCVLWVVSAPVMDNAASDLVKGAVIVGHEFTTEMAQQIGKLSGANIVLLSIANKKSSAANVNSLNIEPLVETVEGLGMKAVKWLEKRQGLKSQSIREILPDNQILPFTRSASTVAAFRFLHTADGVPLGIFGAFKSTNSILAPFESIVKALLAASLLGFTLSIILSTVIARRMVAPIIYLANVAKEIQMDVFNTIKETARTDEVGVLFRAIGEMGKALRDKVELENFLAGNFDKFSFFENEPQESALYQKKDSEEDEQLLQAGNIIAERYEIIKLLGRGASAEVYLALDKMLNERIALKIFLKTEFSEEFFEQALVEIRFARKITHRGVVRTYDLGKTDNLTYLTMEYVKGFTLLDFIHKSEPVRERTGIMLGQQLCLALAAAHAEGIIHGDIKPQNIIITRQGIIKIADFSISRRVDAEDSEIKKISSSQGTPQYMSPEHFRGQSLTVKSDIYSLGLVLYFIFCGKAPYDGKDFYRLLYQHTNEPTPTIMMERSELSNKLSDVILCAMKKSPSERYESMYEFYTALRSI